MVLRKVKLNKELSQLQFFETCLRFVKVDLRLKISKPSMVIKTRMRKNGVTLAQSDFLA